MRCHQTISLVNKTILFLFTCRKCINIYYYATCVRIFVFFRNFIRLSFNLLVLYVYLTALSVLSIIYIYIYRIDMRGIRENTFYSVELRYTLSMLESWNFKINSRIF